MAKLYPPTINENIPAFYKDKDGTVKITVPFSMNRAVLKDEINGFILKIKTVQGNIQLGTKKSIFLNDESSLETVIKNKKVVFTLNESNSEDNSLIENIRVGQFLKAQMAYLNKNDEVGYYSTVGITKYTSKPALSIQGFKTEEDEDYSINHFPTKIIGEYQLGEDKTERPYSYSFSLYNEQDKLLETSGWILYNNNINNTSDSFNTITTLPYYFRTVSEPNINYKIIFQVRTINNLEVFSPKYECMEINVEELLADDIYPKGDIKLETLKFDLDTDNNFEEGYIKIFFKVSQEYSTLNETPEELIKGLPEKEATYYVKKWLNDEGLSYNSIQKPIIYQTKNGYRYRYWLNDQYDQRRGFLHFFTDKWKNIYNAEIYAVENGLQTRQKTNEYFPINEPMSFEICRASDKDNFSKWSVLRRITFEDSLKVMEWSFKDVTIEQGVQYKYSFRQYNDNGLYSKRKKTEPIMADFEDIFLCDNEKQIKIRFNPKVSSFKTTRLESKMDTIGGKHPFIFRNGIVEYKEFPIQGLISYYLDDNEEFLKDSYKELGIVFGKNLERLGNSEKLKDNINQQIKNTSTTNLENYNIKAEREFKLKLSDWLSNGEIKLFKSPSEGNYFVRLMNISLSPEDRLNRMIHNFSCQAYEVMDYNYDNLLNLNYYSLENEAVRYIGNIENININIKIGTWKNKPSEGNPLTGKKYFIEKNDTSNNFILTEYNDNQKGLEFQIYKYNLFIEPTQFTGTLNAIYYGYLSSPLYVERKGDKSGSHQKEVLQDDIFKWDEGSSSFIRNRKNSSNQEVSFQLTEDDYLYVGNRCRLKFYEIIYKKNEGD